MDAVVDSYVDLNGHEIPLAALAAEERELISSLRVRAESRPDWTDFDNFWMNALRDYGAARALSGDALRSSTAHRVAQDLSARLAIASGMARAPDYRDELEELCRTRFKSRREFCEATGLSEDMVSHVLARRKHLSIATLMRAMHRIGYELRIAPRAATGAKAS